MVFVNKISTKTRSVHKLEILNCSFAHSWLHGKQGWKKLIFSRWLDHKTPFEFQQSSLASHLHIMKYITPILQWTSIWTRQYSGHSLFLWGDLLIPKVCLYKRQGQQLQFSSCIFYWLLPGDNCHQLTTDCNARRPPLSRSELHTFLRWESKSLVGPPIKSKQLDQIIQHMLKLPFLQEQFPQ